MGYLKPDIYYNPEHFGLEILGELEFEGGYEHDTFVVWRETATGRIGYAEDSGCSCTSPFEGFTRVEDITFGERSEVVEAAKIAYAERRYGDCTENDLVNLIDKIVNA